MTSEDIWFSGPVKDAISLVGQRNCVFLVYIHDESEKTNALNATLKDEQVIQTIKEHTVALSMEKGSENATLFGQFYPTQTVPILYFIKQGTIRDLAIETVSSEEIVDKIKKVNDIATTPVTTTVTSSIPAVPQQQQQLQQQQTPVTSIPEQSTTVTSVASTSAPLAAVSNTSTTSSPEEIKAKKAELQKQLEQLRKERAEREQQEAKDREIKRRQEAKLMQDARQDRVDKENKIYFDKIKKERLEDEAHRRKVRQQIATDRAEKIAQRNAERERSNSSLNNNINEESASSSTLVSHEFSNLNIRQLDGSNIRNRFEATNTLSTVRDWIKHNRTDDSRKPYKLSSQFPTRLFTEADDETTLADLNLCPSATIIMKPLKKATSLSSSTSLSSNSNGGIIGYVTSAFDFVYGLLIAVIILLTGFLYTLFPTSGPAPHELPVSQQQQPLLRNLRGGQRLGGEASVDTSNRGESSSSATNEISAQKRNPFATRVNTLQEDDMDDDEKKRSTYNGNSVNHE